MSHFCRLRTKITDKATLLQSLKELGYKVEENTDIKGFQGKRTVDIAVRMKGGYDIGFVKGEEGTYEIVADWWGVQGTSKEDFSSALQEKFGDLERRVRRQYARESVLKQTKAQGFNLVEETREDDGTIRLLVRRWT